MNFKPYPPYPAPYSNEYSSTGFPGSQTMINKSVTPVQHISTPMRPAPVPPLPTNTMTHHTNRNAIISQPLGSAHGGYSMPKITQCILYFDSDDKTNINAPAVSALPNQPKSTSRI
jgi:hypothetical protein